MWQQANKRGVQSTAQFVGAAARSARTPAGDFKFDGIQYESWFQLTGLPRLVDLVVFMDPSDGAHHRNPRVALALQDPSGLLG
jgi:hypothetical protein